MSKANVIPMQAQSRPTCLQLVASWQTIWNAKLQGSNRAELDAINHHCALFPPAQQPEVLARVRRITGQYNDPVQIRALVRRGDRAVNHHITAKEA